MRSAVLFLIFCALIPFALFRPYIGIYLWSWFGYMSPHRLTWGFTYDFAFAQIIALVTLLGLAFTNDRSPVPRVALTIVWGLFVLWVNITTLLAVDHDAALFEWERSMKIQLFSFLTIVLINSRMKLRSLVWVIALSIGFFGVKGGLFAIASGAEHRVWGPPGSFIEDNNSIGLAFVMTMPLIWFLSTEVSKSWQKFALWGLLGLTAISALATHSRGAMLGFVTISMVWLVRQKKAWLAVVALVIAAPLAYQAMPDNWKDRMGTLQTYEQDSSAMGRIRAWEFAAQLAAQRPIGAGSARFPKRIIGATRQRYQH